LHRPSIVWKEAFMSRDPLSRELQPARRASRRWSDASLSRVVVGTMAAATILVPIPGVGHGTNPGEAVTVAADEPIPNLPGKRLVSLIVDYPPGAASVPHRHAGSAFIYAFVVSGAIRSQVDDERVQVFRTGEGWFENPGAHHRVSANASLTEPARLLAVFIVDAAEKDLTAPLLPGAGGTTAASMTSGSGRRP
jgi:quercetin dioxygenase-like cupin family protein